MKSKTPLSILLAALVAGALATACGSANETNGSASGLPQGPETVALDPADFTVDIDNPYWPMKPGDRWTYIETLADGTQQQGVVVVTDLTRVIANGITARVVRDTATQDGEIVEDTFDWYAQDKRGNVWYLGEDTAEFDNGKISSTEGSFEAGVDGAQPGIIVPADPEPGMTYREEFYSGQAEDIGEILSIDEQADTPAGHFDNAILTKDTTPLEPDALEYKLYVKGVGPVLALGVSGDVGREVLSKIDTAPPGTGTGPLGNPNP